MKQSVRTPQDHPRQRCDRRAAASGDPRARRAEAVSDAMRRGGGQSLDRRRRVAGLALGAISCLIPVAAYQVGVLRHLPDPPIPGLDSDTVDASGEAYQRFLTADAALGISSYA